MRRRTLRMAVVGVLCAIGGTLQLLHAQQPAPPPSPEASARQPDLILSNGKIITVDERFTIAQAVAIRGDRVVAVGTNQEITRLAGPDTKRIDLRGRAVTPGLIDNHMHLLRGGTTWQWEVRWDGVGSRKQALEMLRARAKAVAPGEWVYNLGGWAIEQFADDKRPFTRDELDQVVPNNPVLLQASYREAYLNSRALQTLGVPEAPSQDPAVVRDAAGKPTGRILEAGFRQLVGKLPTAKGAEVEASTRLMIKDLNKMGLTAFGSAGCEADVLPTFRKLADAGQLNVRVGCITAPGGGGAVEQLLPRIAQMKLFQGDNYIDQIFYGESVYGPLHDPMFLVKSDPKPDQLATWRRIATEIAKAGLPLHVHANLTNTIDGFLDQIEQIHKEYPIKNLRWTLAHVNQLNASHLDRMKKLGMYAAVHPWAVINGGINHAVFGDAAYDMAALRTIQESGIMWGFGSDGTRANQIMPFTTLWWAVTGKMVGGTQVLRQTQTISREDALIAHTRRNAYFLFQEDNLGSIQPGKLADLVVLDRDYLTVPVDQIKDIKSVMTMVGGRIVYDASTATSNVVAASARASASRDVATKQRSRAAK
jgi:predicted amidohydrolase YtcJ